MAQINIASIEAAIREKKAQWTARDHEFLRLSDDRKKRRLGVIPNESRLRELRELPKPDIASVVARELGLRVPAQAGKEERKMSESSAAAGLNFAELYSQILQLIGN